LGYDARLNGIAAESTTSVWGVGSDSGHTLATHWDGNRWTDAPELQLGAGTIFEGVAVVGETLGQWDISSFLAGTRLWRFASSAISPSN